MIATVSLLCVMLAAASPDVGVVLTKRSGVSKGVATNRAALVKEKLQVAGEVQDLTSCQTRLPCLLKEARARNWSTLVAIETANVLGDAIVDVKVLSVEEDGRELARGNAQVAEKDLPAALESRLNDVRKALAAAAPTPPPVVVAPPVPPPAVPEPVEPPNVIAAAAVPKRERPAARWVPLGISLAGLAVGAVGLGISEGLAGELRTGQLDQGRIDGLVKSGKAWRTVGLVGLISGGTLAVASLILGLVWPESRVAPTVFWVPAGGGLAIGGTLP